MAHLALLVPPEALCSPATSPKFSKRRGARHGARPAGARHGRGARHFLGGRRSAAPAEQPARPGRRLQPAPRPALSIARPGKESPRKATALCRAGLIGLSSTQPPHPFPSRRQPRALDRPSGMHTTKGRRGTDNISLWKEVIGMIEAKGLAVSAALDLLFASETLSCFGS